MSPLVPEDVYATHAALIESVLAAVGRSHRLMRDDGDEFASWARVRLLDNDRAILRKFAGRSSLRTFLVTVIERLYLDWRNHEWGKWRPSSEARRLGEVAVELERLIGRDGWPFEQAVASLVSRGMAASAAECERAWTRLPRHPRRQRVDEEALTELAAGSAVDPIEEGDARARERRLVASLERAVAGLPEPDQVILRLRYWSGIKVSRIAGVTGDEPKALYRRFERLWDGLRERLEAEGVDRTAVADLLETWRDHGGEEDA
ncbi:MAG: hypothetical protein IT178_10820 [Acidobacteria bacterium]|nr:hypothetical protein [Acidobacteriota bacterium]